MSSQPITSASWGVFFPVSGMHVLSVLVLFNSIHLLPASLSCFGNSCNISIIMFTMVISDQGYLMLLLCLV